MTDHSEHHLTKRIGWLRAAVLGADDGIVSTASLLVGVAAANASVHQLLITGVAGLVAGSMSMAAGEYVSVSSQADTERADLEREKQELATDHEHEVAELAGIYVRRGLDSALARKVAEQLMAKDALGAHARDELGISETVVARPVQAAVASAISFAAGAIVPILLVALVGDHHLIPILAGTSLVCLAVLGGLAARAGGASTTAGAVRVLIWGALAMAVTAGAGAIFGTGG